ncbi:MAG: LptF/LptG family permease [Trueperaceae bacterium]|nr:LptF/LptG family permease [Trueperaceae bacterium]
MKRFDRYLLRESLTPLILGSLLYSSLLVLSLTIPRLQWVIGVPVGQLGFWLLLQLPAAVVQTLPVALLLAVLLTFGRLAADSELVATQAGGVPLRRASRSFLTLGLACTLFAFGLNERVVPEANARVGSLWWELTSDGSGLFRLARQNVPVGDYTLYFRDTDRSTDELFEVRLESWDDQTLTVIFADRASFVANGLELFNYRLSVLDLSSRPANDVDEAYRQLVRVSSRASSPDQSLIITTSEDYDEIITRYSGGGFADPRSLRDVYTDANDSTATPQERRDAAVLFHLKLVEPLANLALLIAALPLAILYGRSRSVAFGLSLVVTLAWYLLVAVGRLFAQAGSVPVWLGMWGGSLLLVLVGLGLLYARARIR